LSHSQLVQTRRRKNKAKKDAARLVKLAKKLEYIKLHGVKVKPPKAPKPPKPPKAPKVKAADAAKPAKAPKPPKDAEGAKAPKTSRAPKPA
jgi:hypothetical protein